MSGLARARPGADAVLLAHDFLVDAVESADLVAFGGVDLDDAQALECFECGEVERGLRLHRGLGGEADFFAELADDDGEHRSDEHADGARRQSRMNATAARALKASMTALLSRALNPPPSCWVSAMIRDGVGGAADDDVAEREAENAVEGLAADVCGRAVDDGEREEGVEEADGRRRRSVMMPMAQMM